MADIVKPKRQFIPGSVVRVRGQLMGVGKASLLGLLDEAEDIADLSQGERIAAREGVAIDTADAETAEAVEDKIKREAVIKRGDEPADVDAEQAEVESKVGDEPVGFAEEPATPVSPNAPVAAEGDLAAAAEADAKDTEVQTDVPSVEAPAGLVIEPVEGENEPAETEVTGPVTAVDTETAAESVEASKTESVEAELTRGQKAAATRAANKAKAAGK